MIRTTAQMEAWQGEFGRSYSDHNGMSVVEQDAFYRRRYGTTRTQLNERFLGELSKHARILEVGCNRGDQMDHLQQMGFANVYGLELQEQAVKIARQRLGNLEIQRGSIFDIPYTDQSFDLVFTSGVLIHIHPADLPAAMQEIHRCSARYIWGFECFASELVEVNYRGYEDVLWKGNYAEMFTRQFADLRLVRSESVAYLDSTDVNQMYLLEKSSLTANWWKS